MKRKNTDFIFMCGIFFVQNVVISKNVVSLQPHSEMNDVAWCNGSTADFGSACQGSSPCATT